MPKFTFEVDLHREYNIEAEDEQAALDALDEECCCIDPTEDFGYSVVGIVVDGKRTKPATV